MISDPKIGERKLGSITEYLSDGHYSSSVFKF